MRAHSKNSFRCPVLNFGSNRDGKRGVAASATQYHFTIANDAHNRIIHVTYNRTIVDKKPIREAAQSLQRFVFVDADWFVSQVAARRDNRETKFAHEQMMQRRIRKHDAKGRISRRDSFSQLVETARRVVGLARPAVALDQNNR